MKFYRIVDKSLQGTELWSPI